MISSAALHIIQGRIINTPQASVEMFPVVGIATVAIDNQITNYFDCVTDLTSNNGSGIRWAVHDRQRFSVHPITEVSGLPGKRLNLPGITIADLGMYTCWDSYSGDVTNITITDGEFFHNLYSIHDQSCQSPHKLILYLSILSMSIQCHKINYTESINNFSCSLPKLHNCS